VCHNFFVGVVLAVGFLFLFGFGFAGWLHKLSQAAVFCFFSVCRRKKPYVDDIILGIVVVVVFLVWLAFGVAGWLCWL
jgi:hypothetical protein